MSEHNERKHTQSTNNMNDYGHNYYIIIILIGNDIGHAHIVTHYFGLHEYVIRYSPGKKTIVTPERDLASW